MTKSDAVRYVRGFPADTQFSISAWNRSDVEDAIDDLQVEGRVAARRIFAFEKKEILAEFIQRGQRGLLLTHKNLMAVAQEIIEEYDEMRLRVHGTAD